MKWKKKILKYNILYTNEKNEDLITNIAIRMNSNKQKLIMIIMYNIGTHTLLYSKYPLGH